MDKKLQEFSILVLTGTSVLVILLQYVVPMTLEQTQLLYVFDLIIVSVLAADFYSREVICSKLLRNTSYDTYCRIHSFWQSGCYRSSISVIADVKDNSSVSSNAKYS